jgi:hypothetical protein
VGGRFKLIMRLLYTLFCCQTLAVSVCVAPDSDAGSSEPLSKLSTPPSWYRNFPPWWANSAAVHGLKYTHTLMTVNGLKPPTAYSRSYHAAMRIENQGHSIVPPPDAPPPGDEAVYGKMIPPQDKGSALKGNGNELYEMIKRAGGTEADLAAPAPPPKKTTKSLR